MSIAGTRQRSHTPHHLLPEASAGRIALALSTALVAAFTAVQVAGAVAAGEAWFALIAIPMGIVAAVIAGAIARLSRTILPETREGATALWLFAGFVACALALMTIVALTGGHPWTAIFVLPMGLCAFGGGAIALFAVMRRDERAALVLLPLMAGALALYFVAGELISPH